METKLNNSVSINKSMEQFEPAGFIKNAQFIGGLLLHIVLGAVLLYAVAAIVMWVMGQPSLVMLAGGVAKTFSTGVISLSWFALGR